MGSRGNQIVQECAAAYGEDSLTLDVLECTTDVVIRDVHGLYLILAGSLVYFMQTGFALLTAGTVRSRSVKHVLLWNLLDSTGGGLAFWATGYAFAYGGQDEFGGTTFVGHTNFFLMDTNDGHLEYWFFQFTFACALSSIVAGTVAERFKMSAYLVYSSILVGFVYPVVAHAFWSYNGWLSNTNANKLWGSGAVDFAGSGAVHMTGGVTALVAALILGPRMGRFYDENGMPLAVPAKFPPHSAALQFTGVFILWFGWYGFNSGAALLHPYALDVTNVAALATVNTTLAACAASATSMFTLTLIDQYRFGVTTYDLDAAMNGALTGLVGVTAACGTIEPYAAVIIGIVAGWLYLLSSWILIKLRIDDAVNAIPVHLIGGTWGLISAGLFSTAYRLEIAFGSSEHAGWFYTWGKGGDFTLLGIQLIAILFIIGWTGSTMGALFYILNRWNMLRVDPMEEEIGMDIARHHGAAYDMETPWEEDFEENESSGKLSSGKFHKTRAGSIYSHRSSARFSSRNVTAISNTNSKDGDFSSRNVTAISNTNSKDDDGEISTDESPKDDEKAHTM